MTTKELLAELQAHEKLGGRECEVVVRLSCNSIGPLAAVGVENGFFGIDWDNGRFLLNPVEPLILKPKDERLYEAVREFVLRCAVRSNKHTAAEAKRLLKKAYNYTDEELEPILDMFKRTYARG